MKLRSVIASLVQHEDLNFLLTNRIPRRWLTLFLGWFSKLEQPFIRDFSLLVWRLFSDLDLSDARRTHFKSLHDCFTRELKEGARPLNPDPAALVSPCDAIIGASGPITGGSLLQTKGFPYTLAAMPSGWGPSRRRAPSGSNLDASRRWPPATALKYRIWYYTWVAGERSSSWTERR